METEISTSVVFDRIRESETRVVVNEGSARSTKTFSIIQHLVSRCLAEPVKITATRAKLTWAKATMIPDFREIMQNHFQVWDEEYWNKSESTYRFPNGSEFAFVGIDEPQKLHGRKQHYAWVNEAMEIEYREFAQLLIRTERQIIIDYNPSQEAHWIYDKVIPRDDCTFIKSTYRDNPFLEPDIVREIERLEPTPENVKQGTADEVSWKIYGLGERAAHRGLIFSKAKIVPSLPPLTERKKEFYGLDFGYTNDPSALSQIVFAHGELWLHEIFYRRGLTNVVNKNNTDQPSIESLLVQNEVPRTATIWADSAEPKSIAEIRSSGYNIRGVQKGPDSVRSGLEILLRYNINITESSINAIREKNNYKWKEDRSGNATNEPTDAFNHFWDSVRYGVYMEMKRQKLVDWTAISITAPSKWR